MQYKVADILRMFIKLSFFSIVKTLCMQYIFENANFKFKG